MSYRFNLLLKQVKNKQEAMDLAIKIVDTCYENNKEYLLQFQYFLPSAKVVSESDFAKKLGEHNEAKMLNKCYGRVLDSVEKEWIFHIFTFNFIYWPKEKLLALVGDRFPSEVYKLIDESVSFQNSCDQDYPLSHWGKKIKVFNRIIRKFKWTSKKKILQIAKENCDWLDEDDNERMLKNIEYHRLSSIYQAIYDKLHLDNWLWDKEDDYFSKFSMCAITGDERKYQIFFTLQDLKKEWGIEE